MKRRLQSNKKDKENKLVIISISVFKYPKLY